MEAPTAMEVAAMVEEAAKGEEGQQSSRMLGSASNPTPEPGSSTAPDESSRM